MPRKPTTKQKPAKKSAPKSALSTPEPGSLVPAGNGGMIRYGSQKGNTPGTGRPPDAIRAAMREKLDIALPKLWTEYEAGMIDALGFANFLAKYGLGAKELVIASTEAASFFDCVYRATVEIAGVERAVAIKARAIELMDATA